MAEIEGVAVDVSADESLEVAESPKDRRVEIEDSPRDDKDVHDSSRVAFAQDGDVWRARAVVTVNYLQVLSLRFRHSWFERGRTFQYLSLFCFFQGLLLFLKLFSYFWTRSLCSLLETFFSLTTTIAVGMSVFFLIAPSSGPSVRYTYGSGRMHLLLAVCNCLLLFFFCFFTFLFGLLRLYSPPRAVDSLISVSFLGFLVNCFGYLTLRDKHLDSRQHRSFVLTESRASVMLHTNFFTHETFIANFLLFLVAVFVSGKGWTRGDALMAIVTSIMIVTSVSGFFRWMAMILLQAAPPSLVPLMEKCIREASSLEDVLELSQPHVWEVVPGEPVGTINARVRRDANEQLLRARIRDVFANVLPNLTIQIEKDDW